MARQKPQKQKIIPAREALERLRDGNRRFVSNVRSLETLLTHTRRAELAVGQQPFAIVLGCSDSRVPAEIVFDQGLGDLFVIRVAGNIVRRPRLEASSSLPLALEHAWLLYSAIPNAVPS